MDYTQGAVSSIIEGEVRSGFIRKVYGILSFQLLLTTAIAWPIQQMDPLWVANHRQYAQLAMVGSLVAVIGVSMCCGDVARRVPYNYLFLFFVTTCQAIIVGFISAMYTTTSVMQAFCLTAGIFLILTAYATGTKSDFTGYGPYLLVGLCGLLLTSILCCFIAPSAMVRTIMAGAGSILFSFYIVYDTQLICGGKHSKHRFGVDDYVFAALHIYLDIINLFLYILQLIGDRK